MSTDARATLLRSASQPLSARARNSILRLINSPWGNPADPELQRIAATLRAEQVACEVATVGRGEVLLVAASSDGQIPARVFVFSETLRSGVALSQRSLKALSEALSVATRCAPYHAFSPHTPWSTRYAQALYADGPRTDLLDGASFGLSFVWSIVSSYTGLIVPPNLVASCTVNHDATLGPVEQLEQKLFAIARTALAVTEVIVAASQVDRARQCIESPALAGAKLTIRGFESAQQAVDYVFAGREEELSAVAAESFTALRRRILSEHALHWRKTCAALKLLENVSSLSNQDRDTLTTLLLIVRRHLGERDIAMPWDEGLIAERGHAHVAQVVQAAADSGSDQCHKYVEQALERVKQAPAEPGSIRALGACARAASAMLDYESALHHATQAVKRWLKRDELVECSYALCEWLRVAAILRRAEQVDDALAIAEQLFEHPACGPYVKTAAITALVLTHRSTQALQIAHEMSRECEMDSGDEARTALRWVARAHVALNGVQEAMRLREKLRHEAQHADASVALRATALLARLDEACEQRAEVTTTESIIDELRQLPTQGTQWLFAITAPDRAQRIADEYPY
jgi:hypothetical protein